jgi:quercetin 2,3-dioxygenase
MPAVKSYREIREVWKSEPTIEGAGVHLRRAFGFREPKRFDPFLLMDDFRSDKPAEYLKGFPWHPHRGIETITYVLDGDVEHGDSLGHKGIISSGDVQWMTAGSGIIHQEMPKGDKKGRMYGFQLWANLPAKQKMMDPRYRDVKQSQIKQVKNPGGALVRVVAGEVGGVRGPVDDVVIEPEYLDVSLPAGSKFTHTVKPGHTVFAYVFEGEGFFDAHHEAFSHEAVGQNYFDMKPPCSCGDGTLILFRPEGDTVAVTAEAKPVRFLLISGKPLNEPIAWYGPIVMNTQAELKVAFEEFEKGTFIKHKRN